MTALPTVLTDNYTIESEHRRVLDRLAAAAAQALPLYGFVESVFFAIEPVFDSSQAHDWKPTAARLLDKYRDAWAELANH